VAFEAQAMTKVKTIRIHETGGPEVLRVEEVEVGAPRPGQALVRHEAIGVNLIDTYHRSGLYKVASLPSGIGQEAAGVVEAVGEGVSEVRVGDRVAVATAGVGTYAEARLVEASKLVPVPEGVSDEQAAAVLLKGMTVEFLLRRTFRVEPGMTVLFHAAAGGVGLLACQWLAALGATVIGTVSSDTKAELARAHGCHHTIVYTREDFVARVKEITGGAGVPVVYDSVGKDTFLRSLDCLAMRGMLVAFGNASGRPDPFDPMLLAQKGSLFLTRPTLFHYVEKREELLESAREVFDRVARGVLAADPRHTWPLTEAAACHRAMEARETTGSSVLMP
jgi:NADPH2:quinone reductase